MRRGLKFDTDIRPVSEFRANAAELIEQVKTSRRPLVLTELLTDVRAAVKQIDAAEGISNRDAQAELRRRFSR
jgi:PHD/YefM family antitoxin component YafN of YafNO toxin-antitoxin module